MAGLLGLLLRGLLTFLLRRIMLDITDSTWQYTQSGEMGPWNVSKAPKCKDAVRVTVRTMSLMPGSKRAAAATTAEGGAVYSSFMCSGIGHHGSFL